MTWLRNLFAPREPQFPAFMGLDPAIPRIGAGNLTDRGGSAALRAQFGPPHACKTPHPEAAKALGADYGATWRCDCGNVYRFAYDAASQGPVWKPERTPGHPGEIG